MIISPKASGRTALSWLTLPERPAEHGSLNAPLTMRWAKFAYRARDGIRPSNAGEPAMAISDLPIFSMLRTRMNWHQERQRLLAENVANADTPGYRSRDLAPLDFGKQVEQASGQLQLALTSPAHLSGSSATGGFPAERSAKYDVRPTGNAV